MKDTLAGNTYFYNGLEAFANPCLLLESYHRTSFCSPATLMKKTIHSDCMLLLTNLLGVVGSKELV